MSFQQPPPGGNSPPPPPPGGQWGPPPPGGQPGSASGIDLKTINPLDWAAIGAGVLAFIFSFVSFYTADLSSSGSCPPGTSAQLSSAEDAAGSATAWHGFFGWFGVLLALVGAALVAVQLFAPQVSLPFPPRLAALGAFALAAVSEILALFITPGPSDASETLGTCKIEGSVGHGFGYWVTLILVLAGVVLTLMRFQATGGQLPGKLSGMPNIGGYGPQGGSNGQQGGFGPPQGGPPPGAQSGYGQQQPPPSGYQQQPPPAGYQQQPPPPPAGYQQQPPPAGYQQQPPPPPSGYQQQPPPPQQPPPSGYGPQ